MDNNCNGDESPQHQVTLSSYYMDLTETTVAQYKVCVDAGTCSVPDSVEPKQYATYPSQLDKPVNFVAWAQAQAYCQWKGGDLPTEAQWEMAARGDCGMNGSSRAAAIANELKARDRICRIGVRGSFIRMCLGVECISPEANLELCRINHLSPRPR